MTKSVKLKYCYSSRMVCWSMAVTSHRFGIFLWLLGTWLSSQNCQSSRSLCQFPYYEVTMRFSISLKWDAKLSSAPSNPPSPPPPKKKKKYIYIYIYIYIDKKKEKYLSGLFLSSQELFTLELLSEKGAVRVKSLLHKRALIQSFL